MKTLARWARRFGLARAVCTVLLFALVPLRVLDPPPLQELRLRTFDLFQVLRPREQIEAFFDGFILESPGIVQAPLWHPDTRRRPKDLMKIGIYAGAAVKN